MAAGASGTNSAGLFNRGFPQGAAVKDMTLRRCIGIMAASVIALAFLGVALFVMELSYSPSYDQSDPDYQRYAEAFDRLRLPITERGITNEDVIDLSELNGGHWKVACVFGGYGNPLEIIRGLGANINGKDQLRFTEAGSPGSGGGTRDGHRIRGPQQ
jgi:hypothetical protein